MKTIKTLAIALACTAVLSACKEEPAANKTAATQAPTGISPQKMADAIHTVLEADRTTYTKLIVNRLAVQEKVIKASEHWEDDKALLLPAQIFRAGAERVQDSGAEFSYSLISAWPINPQNKPRTDAETKGLDFLAINPGQNFYSEETLGNKKFFTAVYPDVAVAEACVKCHNQHSDSPKTDFRIGDVMGGVVVRIPL